MRGWCELSREGGADRAKLEKRAAREEAAARAAFEAHAARAALTQAGGKPTILRNAGGGGSRDVHLEDFSVSNGGKELIEGASAIGRNGTGKTTFLRALASGEIKGLPPTCQVLHVEQEVVGDDTPVIEAVLECDVERAALLEEEARLMAALGVAARPAEAAPAAAGEGEGGDKEGGGGGGDEKGGGGGEKATGGSGGDGGGEKGGGSGEKGGGGGGAEQASGGVQASGGGGGVKDEGVLTERLNKVWRRLTEIDADGAESRAASILAGLSFDSDMMRRAT
ncbi:ABC transporter F family member, partial [Raphidocelis subcapitata]